MRDRGPRTRMMASGRWAELCCPGSGRRLADDVEAMFVLVALRRLAQLSDNQPQADSRNDKACRDDHDVDFSKICTIFSRLWLFRATNDCHFSAPVSLLVLNYREPMKPCGQLIVSRGP
jgi:hypothetical protein